MKAIQKNKTLKNTFKKLWKKYGNYEKCIEELKNIGFNTTKNHLKYLRKILNLPKTHEILHNKKCVYCGKNAEMFSYKLSPTSISIFLCKKCYRKISHKKYYKKHRIKIIKSLKRRTKGYSIYLGAIECPKCLKRGLLNAHFTKVFSTKHIIGPFFDVAHYYYINGKEHTIHCYIGRDEDLEKRIPPYLLECNCKKCRIKRGEINESNTETKENMEKDKI